MVRWLDMFEDLRRYDALIASMVDSSSCWAMGGSKLILNLCKR